MPYCGEVEVCIMKASLKRAMSSVRLAVLDMDHRCLREGGEQLVRRMGGKGDRMRRACRMRRGDGVIAVIELMEVGIGVPRLVEMQDVDRIPDELLDGVDIVAKAVIGRVGHHHQADLAVGVLGERGWHSPLAAIDSR